MASADRPNRQRPEPDVLRTVVVAYHMLNDLMMGKGTVLDTIRVTRIANGVLERLQRAFEGFPVFLAAISEQEPVRVKPPKTTAESDAINQQLWTLLVVLKAVCRSFLALYGQARQRHIGFLDPEEDEG